MDLWRNAERVRPALMITVAVVAFGAALPRAARQADVARAVLVQGTVIASGTGQPLRGAQVAVIRGGGIEPVVTDQAGRFAVVVPPAAFLHVSKPAFAPALVTRDAAAASGGLRIVLDRGAVLTGLVLDEFGFPVSDARVRARRLEPPQGAAEAGLVEFTADTDDTGAYRIGSLPPGEYAVHTERALPRLDRTEHTPFFPSNAIQDAQNRTLALRQVLERQVAAQSDVMHVEARGGVETPLSFVHRARAVLPPDAPIGGAVTGIVVDESGDAAEGVDVRLWRLQYAGDRVVAEPTAVSSRTDDRGHYRLFHVVPGRYLVVGSVEEPRYAPVYYPDGPDPSAALPLLVGRNEEIAGVNLVFRRVSHARIVGFALDSRGEPLAGMVTLSTTRRSGAIALPARMTSVSAGGAFEFLDVPPGEYAVRATRQVSGSQPVPYPQEFGVEFVTVSGADVVPVTVRTGPTATISGRVVLDGAATGVSPADIALTVLADPDEGPFPPRVPAVQVSADGSFELRGLAGAVRVALARAPAGWWLKAVDVGGIDLSEHAVRFAGPADSRADVTVVVSAAGGAISGRVAGERGEPVDDYRVLVFSTLRQRWFSGSPYVRIAAGPEVDGRFTLGSLPPDDYFVAAVDAIEGSTERGDWQDPDVLDRVAAAAQRVSVGEGARVAADLRLVRWAR